jgi:D-alanine-D-alanine ligase
LKFGNSYFVSNNKLNIKNSKLKVAVLAGGIGSERDVSLQSGKCVSQALKQAGLEVVTADITPDNMEILHRKDIDVFFLALHGKFGEDGQLQQILQEKSLVYTGSGPQASAMAFNKIAGKKAFVKAGVKTPSAIVFNDDTNADRLRQLTDKYVIKPITQGSSVGVSIVTDPEQAVDIAKKTQAEFGDCMIEEFIQGREFTVSILCDKPLPIIEIRPKEQFYNYYAKYIDDRTEFLFDTIGDPSVQAKIETVALSCFKSLGCRHFARIDFILNRDMVPYALEANTIPGFTTHSLLPTAAAKAGLNMSDLCVKIIDAAWEDKDSFKFPAAPAIDIAAVPPPVKKNKKLSSKSKTW